MPITPIEGDADATNWPTANVMGVLPPFRFAPRSQFLCLKFKF